MNRSRVKSSLLLLLLCAGLLAAGPLRGSRAQSKAPAPYVIKPEQKRFWSFQPIGAPAVPAVQGKTNNAIDAFLLEKLEARELGFSRPAGRRALLRRASYDLTGLPPTPEEVDAFLADASPDAFARVVDRLLASPRYGERWARHWLDLARYSDTLGPVDAGKNTQGWFPYAYTFRDWVIRAFNEDLPYDQFLQQQLAADRLPGNDPRNLAALGFLALTRGGLGVTREEKLDDKVDLVSRGLLGLTVSCARCHNHKFDPIPTRDYYALFTIFANTREPEELPLLASGPAASDKYTQALQDERRKIADEIAKNREKRFPELKALYRTAPELAKLLTAAHEARAIAREDELSKFAQEKDYNLFLLTRWREYLKAHREDAVWKLWQRLDALPDAEFASRVRAEIAAAAPLPAPVAAAFAEPPASLRDAAESYGKLLAAHDKPAPCANPEEEALRRVLHADDSPTNVQFADYEKLWLSTDRQIEYGKQTRIENLFLAQAYEGAPPRAQSVVDAAKPVQGHVLLRGNPANEGEPVQPWFLQILAGDDRQPFKDGSGRLDLARAIADPANPLTARVFVNRVWQHHFGAGLVRTPSDFGARGDRPTHPELLDYLARDFIDHGWSVKRLHRMIMLSRAYQQSSEEGDAQRPSPREIDPENKLLWKMNRRRLDFEEVRDSLLAAGGTLDPKMYGLPASPIAWPYDHRRTVYAFIDRALVPNDFRAFDFASPDAHSPQRYLTTVPQQALMMMNSPFVIEQARALLERPDIRGAAAPRARITRLYRLLFGRAPTAAELSLGLAYLREPANDEAAVTPADEARMRAWSYGQGPFDAKEKKLKAFTPFQWFVNGAWRSSAMPGDPRTPTSSLSGKGGYACDDKSRALVRRWTAPFTGRIAIAGLVEQNFENGCRKCDGLPVHILSSRAGSLGDWPGTPGKAETAVAEAAVTAGDTIDFIVEPKRNDEIKWTVTIRRLDGAGEEWNSARDFRHPAAQPLTAWHRYAQALLCSAEFILID